MTSLSSRLYDALIDIINTYKPYEQIVVSRENVIGDTPDYPYITVNQYDDPAPITRDRLYTQLTVPVQFKAISDDEDQAKDLGLFLRRLFYYEEPLEQLDKQGIKPVKCDAIPGIPSYADNLIQFTSGADITFVVIDDIVDMTRGNQELESVSGIVGTKDKQAGINAERKDE